MWVIKFCCFLVTHFYLQQPVPRCSVYLTLASKKIDVFSALAPSDHQGLKGQGCIGDDLMDFQDCL